MRNVLSNNQVNIDGGRKGKGAKGAGFLGCSDVFNKSIVENLSIVWQASW